VDTGDVVLHKPTGERWVTAYVSGENLCCLGWPESFANVSDCTLIKEATPEERLLILKRMADMSSDDARKRYAIHRLSTAEQVLPKEQ
jgi:hypothetical protein